MLDLGLSKETIVVIISTLPIVELRGALPVAINVFHLSWHRALPLAIAGNLIPVPLLLLFFGAISRRLSRIGIFRRWINWLEEHSRQRGKIIERYKRLGLILLVAIPLPFTGAWTGSLVATIFEVRFRQAFLAILTGVCIAGAIVTAICLLALKWL
ncbi:MAG: small multi-drug export protein [Dehalococcoidales bacterium]|nr:small multi-drug export protein [Dehalococcoidales bacterium]